MAEYCAILQVSLIINYVNEWVTSLFENIIEMEKKFQRRV